MWEYLLNYMGVGSHEDGHCLMNVWAYKKYLQKYELIKNGLM